MTLASEILADTPTAFWPMTDSSAPIVDSIGGISLPAQGTPTYRVVGLGGIYGIAGATSPTAYHRSNGTTGGPTSLLWTLGSDFTIELMVKRNTIDAVTTALLGQRDNSLTNFNFACYINSGVGFIFDIGNGASTDRRWNLGSGAPSDLLWHHLIFRYRGSDGFRDIIIDGKVVASTTVLALTACAVGSTLSIGSSASASASETTLSHVAIYNGTRLSDARAKAHWLATQNLNTGMMF